MKINFNYIYLVLVAFSCNSKDLQEKEECFKDYINNFQPTYDTIFFQHSWKNLPISGKLKEIPDKYLELFVCETLNYCKIKERFSGTVYKYGMLLQKNEKYITVCYYESDGPGKRIWNIVTYSLETYEPISKIIPYLLNVNSDDHLITLVYFFVIL